MKTITSYQPWASLLACGAKRYETRSWATSYRGPIFIHAGKEPWYLAYFQGNRPLQDAIIKAFGGIPNHERGSAKGGNFYLPYGVVIATAELVECREICRHIGQVAIRRNDSAYSIITDDELLFGDWMPGRYAWEFADMTMLPESVAAKGRQGLWNWEMSE